MLYYSMIKISNNSKLVIFEVLLSWLHFRAVHYLFENILPNMSIKILLVSPSMLEWNKRYYQECCVNSSL